MAACLLLLGASAWSAALLWDEGAVAGAALRLERHWALADAGRMAGIEAPTPPASANPRALLADALLRLRLAEPMAPGAERAMLIEQAGTAIEAAMPARPWFGEAWMLEAYRQSLIGPAGHQGFARALERSYADAPYLKESGGWRVSSAFAAWGLISPEARRAAVREAVWLARMNKDNHAQVVGRARQSDGYVPFMVEYMQSRSGDADFAPIQGAAPWEARQE